MTMIIILCIIMFINNGVDHDQYHCCMTTQL